MLEKGEKNIYDTSAITEEKWEEEGLDDTRMETPALDPQLIVKLKGRFHRERIPLEF